MYGFVSASLIVSVVFSSSLIISIIKKQIVIIHCLLLLLLLNKFRKRRQLKKIIVQKEFKIILTKRVFTHMPSGGTRQLPLEDCLPLLRNGG